MMPATSILLADVLGASTGDVGMLAACGAAAALVGNFVWGRLVDRRSALFALRAVYLVARSPRSSSTRRTLVGALMITTLGVHAVFCAPLH